MQIIYIDDEADSAAMRSKFEVMQEFGFEVIPVTEIDNALPSIRNHASSLDAIIVDRIMPPRSVYSLDETNGGISTGLRLLKDIRAEFPSVPIVIVSVIPNDAREKMNIFQVAEYVTKPVDGEKLAMIMQRILEKGQINV